MTEVLLTQQSISDVKAGVEVFSEHLNKAFPKISTIDINKANAFNKFDFIWPIKEPLRALATQKYLLNHIKEICPEVIFANGEFAWYLNKSKLNIPLIVINHGGWKPFALFGMKKDNINYYRTKYIYSFFEKKSFENANKIICVSKFTRDLMKQYYNLEGELIYNGIDTEVFKPVNKEKCRLQLGLPSDKRIALFVSSPSYCKGFDIVVKLSKIFKDVIFVFVTFPQLNIKQDNILCFEAVSSYKLNIFYNAADIVLFPSRFEGFGYVPLEALACNKQVISGKTGLFEDFAIKKIPNTVILNDYKIESYTSAINKIFEQNREENSRKWVKDNFSLKSFIKNYRKLIS